jgi:hypothetical protein
MGLADTVILFLNYLNFPLVMVFKETTFSAVTTLEFPYPISIFCYSAIFEIYLDTQDRLRIFMLRPEKIFENIMRNLGSITMNLMTAPDCLPQLDGTCFGSRIGIAINLILQP